METMTPPWTFPVPESEIPTVIVNDEFSRADLMTPFSLSLAAEKAIERAKDRLDQMDSRLLRARTSIAVAKSLIHRASAEQLHGRKISSSSFTLSTAPSSPEPNSACTFQGSKKTSPKTTEMVRLRDDLRRLRSKMGQSRAISETLNLTPPRVRRPRPVLTSEHSKPEIQKAAQPPEDPVIDRFPLPPKSVPVDDNPARRLSEPLAGQPPELWPTVEVFGRFVNRDDTSNFGSPQKEKPEPLPPVVSDDLPIMTAKAEAPFSPRPDSSQSLLISPASPTPISAPFPTSKIKPFPTALKVSFPETPNRRRSPVSSAKLQRPSLKAGAFSSSRISYVTANESFTDLGLRHSRSSLEYSDPDTSIGDVATPEERYTTTNKTGSKRTVASRDSLRPRSFISEGSSFASLSSVNKLTSGDQELLLRRCHRALQKITVSGADKQEQSKRRGRLEAVLAILEDEE